MTEPMTDLADRLADALSARATAVLPDPRAYERVVARRRRRHVTRWAAVGAAGIATASVVALVAIVPGGGDAPAPPAVGPNGTPAHFIAVVDGKAGIFDTAKPDGFTSFGPTGYRTTAVASQGDDLHFWSASVAANDCRSLLQQVDHTGVTFRAHDLKGGDEVAGEVDALAVTDDATRLAYALWRGPECTTHELHVRDLRTGADRVWRFPGNEDMGSLQPQLSWAPDGRHLAYLTGCCEVRILDATAPGDDLYDAKWHEQPLTDPRKPGMSCEVQAAAYRGTTGDLAAFLQCDGGGSFVATYDPATGRLGNVLFDAPQFVERVAFDRSGDHAYLEVGSGSYLQREDGREHAEDNPVALYQWDRGGAVRRAGTGKHFPFGVDW